MVYKNKQIMIHTVHLDDEYVNVKELLKEIHSQKQGVRFDNHIKNGAAHNEYMTSEEFRKHAITKVNKFCDKNGIL